MRRALILASLLAFGTAAADVTNWKSPDSATCDDGNWTDPTNALASDDARAISTAFTTTLMYVTDFDFDEAGADGVPASATVTGVEISIEGHGSHATSANREVYTAPCYDASCLTVGTPVVFTLQQTTDSVITDGGSSSLWDLTLTPTIVRGAEFGVQMEVAATSGQRRVDQVLVRIHYTPAAGRTRRAF